MSIDPDQRDEELCLLRRRVQELEAERAAAEDRRPRDVHLRHFAEHIDEAFWLISPDETELYHVSPAFETLTGFPCAHLRDDPTAWLQMIHPDDRRRIRGGLESLEAGSDQCLGHECRVIRKDGTLIWVWLRSYPVHDETGRLTCRAGVAVDITGHKRVEDRLTIQGSILDATPDFVGVAEPDGRVLYVNQGARRMAGLAVDVDVTRFRIKDFHPGWATQILEQESIPTAIRQGTWRGELAVLTRDGKEIPVSSVIMAHRAASGAVHRLSTIMRDISERKQLEAERDRFFNESLSLLCIASVDGYFHRLNPAWKRTLGFSDETLKSRPFVEFVHPDDREATITEIQRLAKGVDTVRFENRYRCRDGSYRWLEWDCPAPQAGETHLYAAARDVTLRKRAEAALRESEERFRLMTDTLPVLIAYVDREQRYQFTNTAFRAFLDTTPERIHGRHVQDMVGPDAYEILRPKIEEALSGKTVRFEPAITLNDGSVLHQDSIYVPHRSPDGEVLGLYALVMDTTQRKQAEDALRASEERFRQLAENINEVFWLTEWPPKRVIYISPAYDRIWAQNAEAIYADPDVWIEAIVPEDVEAVERAWEGAADGDFDVTYRIRRPDGTLRWIHDRGFPIRNQDGVVYRIAGIAEDITTQHEAEARIRQYQENLRTLASDLAVAEERERRGIAVDLHDRIGQTLGLAQIKLEALRDNAPPEWTDPLHECIALVHASIQDTRSLVFDLSPPILYDLGFEAAAEWLVDQFDGREGIRLTFEDDGQSKPLDEAVRIILFRSSRELLVNIVKHARATCGRLTLKRCDGEIRVEVVDDGIGFDPTASAAPADDSSGFGLFSIREQFGRLGGRIDIRSTPDTGTRIILWAPLTGGNTERQE